MKDADRRHAWRQIRRGESLECVSATFDVPMMELRQILTAEDRAVQNELSELAADMISAGLGERHPTGPDPVGWAIRLNRCIA